MGDLRRGLDNVKNVANMGNLGKLAAAYAAAHLEPFKELADQAAVIQEKVTQLEALGIKKDTITYILDRARKNSTTKGETDYDAVIRTLDDHIHAAKTLKRAGLYVLLNKLTTS